MNKVRKAIFPVGGLGTRFLPATKAIPKEMLPIVDKPLIQYAIEEAAAAGIEEFIFVTGRGKEALENHFDRSVELEAFFEKQGKTDALAKLAEMHFKPGQIYYTRQQEPLGLGHAVWCARHIIKDEPFALLLADDFIEAPVPCLKQMMDLYAQGPCNILSVMDVQPDQVSQYGIVQPALLGSEQQQSFELSSVVEKPSPEAAPSSVAIVGRYILQPEIFQALETQPRGRNNEIQLTDAFLPLMQHQKFKAYRFEGKRFDCGSKAGYVAANIHIALKRPDIAPAIKDML